MTGVIIKTDGTRHNKTTCFVVVLGILYTVRRHPLRNKTSCFVIDIMPGNNIRHDVLWWYQSFLMR